MEKKSKQMHGVCVTYNKRDKIEVGSKDKNRFIPRFVTAVVALTVLSLFYLKIDWIKLA